MAGLDSGRRLTSAPMALANSDVVTGCNSARSLSQPCRTGSQCIFPGLVAEPFIANPKVWGCAGTSPQKSSFLFSSTIRDNASPIDLSCAGRAPCSMHFRSKSPPSKASPRSPRSTYHWKPPSSAHGCRLGHLSEVDPAVWTAC